MRDVTYIRIAVIPENDGAYSYDIQGTEEDGERLLSPDTIMLSILRSVQDIIHRHHKGITEVYSI